MPFKFQGPEDLAVKIRVTTTGGDADGGTLAIGDLLYLSIGSTTWSLANTSSAEHFHKKLVITRIYNTTNDVEGILVHEGQLWEASTLADSAAAQDGDRMLTAGKNLINNSGTDNTSEEAVFVQLAAIQAAGDRRILGFFTGGGGVNPDAT
jgi:hypothetical protein